MKKHFAQFHAFITEQQSWLGSSQKTESMVTPVFATPILTTSWLA
ncbi:hypothetical protein [Klebsiella pneumoniae]|jgi:hypothetical protein|nr:hypothetical protein [Klebsiella pneumoniae]SYS47321.1 IS903D transposase [Klebsiella pneumoniae]